MGECEPVTENWNNRDVALMAPYSEAGLHIIFRAKSDADGHFVIE